MKKTHLPCDYGLFQNNMTIILKITKSEHHLADLKNVFTFDLPLFFTKQTINWKLFEFS